MKFFSNVLPKNKKYVTSQKSTNNNKNKNKNKVKKNTVPTSATTTTTTTITTTKKRSRNITTVVKPTKKEKLVHTPLIKKVYTYFLREYTKDIPLAGISASPRHTATISTVNTILLIPISAICVICGTQFILPLILSNMIQPTLQHILTPFIAILLIVIIPTSYYFSKLHGLRDYIKRRKKSVDGEIFFFTVYCDVVEKTGKGLRGAFEMLRLEGMSDDPYTNTNSKKSTHNHLFPSMYKEACIIHREIQVFSKSFIDIIRHTSSIHPSNNFKDFLRGYIISQESGGTGASIYLQEKLREYHNAAQRKLDSYGNTSEMLATVGSFGLVMFPIFIVVGGIIIPPATLLFVCVFGIIVIPIMIIFLIRMAQKMNPIQTPKIKLPLLPIVAAVVVGMGLFVLSILLADMMQLSTIGSDIVVVDDGSGGSGSGGSGSGGSGNDNDGNITTPLFSSYWEIIVIPLILWSIINYSFTKHQLYGMSKLEKSIPDFIRDINQKTKSNPSFYAAFTSIESASPYTKQFNHMLHMIKSQLLLGANMANVLSKVHTNSWLCNCTMRLLSYAVRTGSVTPAVLDRLSMFVSHYLESRKNLAEKTATPLMTGYMGSIIVVMMILMIPMANFDVSFGTGLNPSNTGEDIILNNTGGFDPHHMLSELNMILVIIGAFCSMVLIAQIRYGTILHSMHTGILLAIITAIFYYDRYAGGVTVGG